MQQNKNSTLFPCKKYYYNSTEKGNEYKLIKYIQTLYAENYRALMGKKIKEVQKKKKKIEIPGSWIRKLSISKMSVVFKLIYEFSVIQTKTPERYLISINNMILKFICKGKETRISTLILKRNSLGGFTLPKFKTYYKATVQCC